MMASCGIRVFLECDRDSEKIAAPRNVKPSEKKYGRDPRPVRLYTVNVDDAKAEILSSLGLARPGPGYLHLPLGVETVNEELVAQLTAEQRVTRYTKAGVAYSVWVQTRERNDALDAAVLSLAALRLLRPNLIQMAERIRQHVAQEQERRNGSPGTPEPAAPKIAPVPERRVMRSSYLA